MSKYLSFIILVMASFVLVACGGSGRGSSNNASSDSGISTVSDISATDIAVIETDENIRQNTETPNLSLTEAAAFGSDNGTRFILQGLVVQGRQTVNYTVGDDAFGWTRNSETSLEVVRVLFPAVSVDFDADGHMSGVTAHFANKEYQPIIGRNTTLDANNLDGTLFDDLDSITLNVDRSSDFFGFQHQKSSNYMAHIGWRVEKELSDYIDNPDDASDDGILSQSYVITGSMIAGIETQDFSNITQSASFVGGGRGYYSYGETVNGAPQIRHYTTIFDVLAEVDFGNNSLTVSSSNTQSCEVVQQSFCKISSNYTADNSLDFGTPNALTYSKNIISGDVTLIGNDAVAGIVDARFYGADAWEFGGTFALYGAANNAYYYGAFGTERGGITNSSAGSYGVTDQQVSNAQATYIDNILTGNQAVIDAIIAGKTGDNQGTNYTVGEISALTGTNSFAMRGVSVYRDVRTDYSRAPNRDWSGADKVETADMFRLRGGAASLTFNNSGYISDVTVYLNGKNYGVGNFNAVSDTVVYAPIAARC